MTGARSGRHAGAGGFGAEHRQLVEALGAGALFGQAGPVELRETHASLVYLTPSDVYKLKKPVDLGFLDYSTLRRRGRMCRQEVALNRRLAPGVYLGVEKVTRERDGAFRLNGRGRVVDYLVHMRRLPDERSLGAMAQAGTVSADDLRRVGERIAAFHNEAAIAPARFGPSTFFRNARENLAALEAGGESTLPAAVPAKLARYLDQAPGRFGAVLHGRVAAGRIRDGHGDLRAEHVYLDGDTVEIIDCVEFSPRYRLGDTALDLAFLVMDLAAGGFPDLVEPLVEAYEAASGDAIGEVLPLYSWYRALVRAKVAGVVERDPGVTAETRWGAALSLRRYVYHALRFAREERRPVLFAVGGLPGTGKTTLAKALGAATGAAVTSADATRKRIAGLGSGVHPESALDGGLYTREMNHHVYSALAADADDALRRGRSVVVDATLRRRADRERLREAACARGARFLFVECSAPEAVVVERLQRRALTPDAWSDATIDTYQSLRAEFEPASELAPGEHVRVSTENRLAGQVDEVLWRL
ncbi:MAG: AAA family ATPase [Chloroflexi bacterium]|nr:AAA family ATPase [Chloroflexota bacterium]